MKLEIVPFLILFYFCFKKINDNVHKLYLREEDKEIEEIQEKEDRWERGNRRKVARNVIILILCGILLFVVGNLLGDTLGNLGPVLFFSFCAITDFH